MFAHILPSAIEKHSKFSKNNLELFASSLIVSLPHLRLVMIGEMKEFPFDALLEWMINLLLAYRITVDDHAGSEASASHPTKSEYIFFPLLGQFTSKSIRRKDVYQEFQDNTWKLFVRTREPISTAFYYKFLALLIQMAFECQTSAERVNCFRISSHGQLATIRFHADNSPMYFKLMVEFHETQRIIEIRMKLVCMFYKSNMSNVLNVCMHMCVRNIS